MTSEILKDARLLLDIPDDEENELLSLYVTSVVDEILAYCRMEFLPKQLYGLAAQIAAAMFKGEGRNIKALTEGERRVEFAAAAHSVIEDYYERLKPFRRVGARLPSEITEDNTSL